MFWHQWLAFHIHYFCFKTCCASTGWRWPCEVSSAGVMAASELQFMEETMISMAIPLTVIAEINIFLFVDSLWSVEWKRHSLSEYPKLKQWIREKSFALHTMHIHAQPRPGLICSGSAAWSNADVWTIPYMASLERNNAQLRHPRQGKWNLYIVHIWCYLHFTSSIYKYICLLMLLYIHSRIINHRGVMWSSHCLHPMYF